MEAHTVPAPQTRPCTAFVGHQALASGPLADVALAVKAASADGPSILVFDDATGRVIDLDLRGTPAEILARLSETAAQVETVRAPAIAIAAQSQPRGRGRPRLGVVAREITLLP